MSEKVLYRKWRPLTFNEVVGQEHVTKTLKNSIELNQTSHAYLFTGPRGVGKTTTVINLAAGLSMKGKKILVIDLDPQGNATTGLGLSNSTNSESTIYSVLNGNRNISEVIKKQALTT